MPMHWIDNPSTPGFKKLVNTITLPEEAWIPEWHDEEPSREIIHPMTLFLDMWEMYDLDSFLHYNVSWFHYHTETMHISEKDCCKEKDFEKTPVWCIRGGTWHLPGSCPFDPANMVPDDDEEDQNWCDPWLDINIKLKEESEDAKKI